MRFQDPQFFSLLWLVPALLVFLIAARRRHVRAEEQLVGRTLLPKLVVGEAGGRHVLKAFLILAGVLLAILAVCRPQSEDRLGAVTVKRTGVDIIIALDTSASMLAEDIKPNRLARAKQEITGLLDRLRGDRVGLVAFSGESFVQCPLTLDYGAARVFLEEFDTNLIPEPGTAIGAAVSTASGAFVREETQYKVLVVMTDGEDHEGEPVKMARKAADAGIRIFTIGFGRTDGEPIPLRDQEGNLLGFKKDKQGNIVMSRLNEGVLQEIALVTGGKYYRATAGGVELDRIYDEISKLEKKEIKSRILTAYKDWFQIPLALAFLLLVLEFALADRKSVRRTWGGRFE
ncbi:MAG: VWA domain-containing protein [Candidatus Eisenbacteria sp.]|nr:VWA domain-containing protein [Candidatus Eisenbacteria bacterium]